MNDKTNNTPVWDAEASNPENCAKLRKAMRQVRDPEIGMDLIQLGLIRNVKMNGNETIINMILTTPYCPYGPTMLESARVKAQEALNSPVRVEFGEEIWEMSMMEEGNSLDWGLM